MSKHVSLSYHFEKVDATTQFSSSRYHFAYAFGALAGTPPIDLLAEVKVYQAKKVNKMTIRNTVPKVK